MTYDELKSEVWESLDKKRHNIKLDDPFLWSVDKNRLSEDMASYTDSVDYCQWDRSFSGTNIEERTIQECVDFYMETIKGLAEEWKNNQSL